MKFSALKLTMLFAFVFAGTACSTLPPDCDYNGDEILSAIVHNNDEQLLEELDGDPVPSRDAGKLSYLELALRFGNVSAAKILVEHGAQLTPNELDDVIKNTKSLSPELEEFLRPLFPHKMVLKPFVATTKLSVPAKEPESDNISEKKEEILVAEKKEAEKPKKVIFNPFLYVESGEKMGVVIYTEGEKILGVESCAIGKGGYSGCGFTYRSSGNQSCHEHFRDNVHVTGASGATKVIGCNADGEFQSWERHEYDPDAYFEKTLWLARSEKPITAVRADKQADGSYEYHEVDDTAFLKKAMEILDKGEKNSYFVSRYGSVSKK